MKNLMFLKGYYVDLNEKYRGKALIFTMMNRLGCEEDITELHTTLISLDIDVQHVLNPSKEVGIII